MKNKFKEAKQIADQIHELKTVRFNAMIGSLIMLAMSLAAFYSTYLDQPEYTMAFNAMIGVSVLFGAFSLIAAIMFFALRGPLLSCKADLAQICLENHTSLGFATPEMMIAHVVQISIEEAKPQGDRKETLTDTDHRKKLLSLYTKAVG